jgi:hypothetical protein
MHENDHTTDDHTFVVALTADHLRAIEAALDLARAVVDQEIRVADPDEVGQAMIAAEGLTELLARTP